MPNTNSKPTTTTTTTTTTDHDHDKDKDKDNDSNAMKDSESNSPTSALNLTLSSLDLLRRFLELVDAQSAALIPNPSTSTSTSTSNPTSTPTPTPALPIDQWTLLHSSTAPPSTDRFPASISVRRHPDPNSNTLFSVTSVLPNVSALQFWTLMANSSNRPLWDTAAQDISIKRSLQTELHKVIHVQDTQHPHRGNNTRSTAEIARELASRVEFLSFGSIFMVAKPRDMVLLGSDVRLPHTSASAFKHESSTSAPPRNFPLRLASTCASIEDPSLPPRKGYQRFHLVVGGFMVEDLSLDPNSPAIRITQVSDLGPASTWLPSSIIKMVAQTLVPRSMSGIRKIAEKIEVPRALSSEKGAADKIQTKINSDGEQVQKLKGAGGEWPLNRGLPGILGEGALDFSNRKEEKEVKTSMAATKDGKEAIQTLAQMENQISHSLSASTSAREEQEKLAREAGENLSKSMRRISMLLARNDSDENTSGNSSELESSVEDEEEEEDEDDSSGEDDSREDEPRELEDSSGNQDSLFNSNLSKVQSKVGPSNEDEAMEHLHDDREIDSIPLSNSIPSLRSAQRSTPSSPIASRRTNQGMRLGQGLGILPSSSSSSSASLVQGRLTPPVHGGPTFSGASPQEDLSPFSSSCSSSSYFSHGTSTDGGWRGGRRPGLNNGLTGGVYTGMGLSDEKFRRATLNLARHVVGGPPSSTHGSEMMSRSQSNQSQATQSTSRSEMSEEGEYSENESLRGTGSSVGGNQLLESDEDRWSRDGNEDGKESVDDEEDYDRTLLSSALNTNSSPFNSPNRLPPLNTLNLSSPPPQAQSPSLRSQSSSPTSSNHPAASSPPLSPTRRSAMPPRQSPLRRQHALNPQAANQSSRSLMGEIEETRGRRLGMIQVDGSIEENLHDRHPTEENRRALSTLEESPDLDKDSGTNRDSQGGGGDIAFLLAEALGQDLRPPSLRNRPFGSSNKRKKRSSRVEGSNFSTRSGVGSPSRREIKLEREAKRLSAMLLMGSDQLAMAIAPGARGSNNNYGMLSLEDGDEFGVSDIVIEDSEEDEVRIGGNSIPNLDSNQQPFTSTHLGQFTSDPLTSDPQFLGPGDGSKGERPSVGGRRPSADSSGSSAHTTTGLESSTNAVDASGSPSNASPIASASLAASLFNRSRRFSENNVTVASSPAPPTTTATSVLVDSTNSEGTLTSNDLNQLARLDSGTLESLQSDGQLQQDAIQTENHSRWGSSLAGAPYTLVIGIASLAWATRYSTQSKTHQNESNDIIAPDGSSVKVKQRAPSSSAADAVRRVMNGDLERRNTAPPDPVDSSSSSSSRPEFEVSDSKLSGSLTSTNPGLSSGRVDLEDASTQTDSFFSNRSSHTGRTTNSRYGSLSNPTSIPSSYSNNHRTSTSASSSSSIRSRSSKLYAYHGGPAVIPEDGSISRSFSRGNYAFNDKLHPFPASIGSRKELPPIGNGVGAVPLDRCSELEREAPETDSVGPKGNDGVQNSTERETSENVNHSSNASYISWISGYLPATGR